MWVIVMIAPGDERYEHSVKTGIRNVARLKETVSHLRAAIKRGAPKRVLVWTAEARRAFESQCKAAAVLLTAHFNYTMAHLEERGRVARR